MSNTHYLCLSHGPVMKIHGEENDIDVIFGELHEGMGVFDIVQYINNHTLAVEAMVVTPYDE